MGLGMLRKAFFVEVEVFVLAHMLLQAFVQDFPFPGRLVPETQVHVMHLICTLDFVFSCFRVWSCVSWFPCVEIDTLEQGHSNLNLNISQYWMAIEGGS